MRGNLDIRTFGIVTRGIKGIKSYEEQSIGEYKDLGPDEQRTGTS